MRLIDWSAVAVATAAAIILLIINVRSFSYFFLLYEHRDKITSKKLCSSSSFSFILHLSGTRGREDYNLKSFIAKLFDTYMLVTVRIVWLR